MKTILATIALSTLSALSFADATEFSIPAGTLTRAEVIAAIGNPSAVSRLGDVTVFAEPTGSTLTRAQVLAEAAADRAARGGHGESSTLRFARAADQDREAARPAVMADAGMSRSGARFGDANRDDINQRTR